MTMQHYQAHQAALMLTRDQLSETVKRLLDEEQRALARAEEQVEVGRRTGWTLPVWTNAVANSKARIRALKEGLLPVRIGGRHVTLRTLIREQQPIPPNIIRQAEEAQARLPGNDIRVYGWDANALPEERRSRDPILTMHHGGREFLLGFWLEVDTGRNDAPGFIGFTMPWAVHHRGRPSKERSLYE